MTNNQYTYNQPPMEPMMPPQEPMPMGQRVMRGLGRMKDAFPKWLSQYSLGVYIAALAVVSFMYSTYSLPWYYMLSGVVAIIVFFLFGSNLADRTSPLKMRREKTFEQRIFLIAFVPRVIWMFLIYAIFMQNYGDAFGFENADAVFYDELGQEFADALHKGNFSDVWKRTNEVVDLSDLGYATYLGVIYWMTNKSILIVRLIKCVLSALTVLLVYRLAKRNFGEQIGRISSIFCALWPNFWYYCGCQLKEVEMVFLAVLFVEQADQMLRSRNFTAWKVIPILLIASALFTIRMPLALVALLSLVFSVVMSSSKVVSWGKRVMVGGLVIILVAITMGNRIMEEANGLMNTARSGQQETNMEWRTTRDNGNKFAKYAGKSVFAPLIFTIPFPSMVRPFDGQDLQQLLNGGNFIKNILSAFTIFAMFTLLISGRWRDVLLPLSFLLGYLVVLTMSEFAQSERFHQPVMPFEFMFAAYGLSIAVTKPKYKRWYMYWCGFMFIACIAWNWFKMAGRDLS